MWVLAVGLCRRLALQVFVAVPPPSALLITMPCQVGWAGKPGEGRQGCVQELASVHSGAKGGEKIGVSWSACCRSPPYHPRFSLLLQWRSQL